MALRLNSASEKFDAELTSLLARERETRIGGADVPAVVAQIIADVRERGDTAVAEKTHEYDRFSLSATGMRFADEDRFEAERAVSDELKTALHSAAERIRIYHEKQLPADAEWVDAEGVKLGWRWTALDSVGLYVPGGLAAYPSSVLMNAIPAKVAGVERIVMVVPTPDGVVNAPVLYAASLAGVDEIYRIGGAQAIATLAYGTQTVKPVDKIVGPGNAFVAEAKRQVFGKVGIDTIAGPSEILVVSDNRSEPDWIAADLLSQAEHDPAAQSILITDDADFADIVEQRVSFQLGNHPRRETAGAAWANNSAIIVVETIAEAPGIINRIAPEHLELCVDDFETLMPHIKHAGAIFQGRYTPEAIGDYAAGPNHVLPTTQVARYASGLSAIDFIKRSTIMHCTPESLAKIASIATVIADAEGLHSHAQSVAKRI